MWPIQLPYGLSDFHRLMRTTGEVPAVKDGIFLRFQFLTLDQIAAIPPIPASATQATTKVTPTSRLAPPTHTGPQRVRRNFTADMGNNESIFQHTTPTVPHRYNTISESRTLCPSTSQHTTPTARKKGTEKERKKYRKRRKEEKLAQQESLRPGVRPGARRDQPINLDSEEESEEHASTKYTDAAVR